MFKKGDVVYCTTKENIVGGEYWIAEIFSDMPFDVLNIITPDESEKYKIDQHIYLELNGLSKKWYNSKNFISENDYKISKRLEKIKKIKECLKLEI